EKAEKFQPVLELNPDVPPESFLLEWILGICAAAGYGTVGFLWWRRRKKPLKQNISGTVQAGSF
ncbi:MAG: hypothetical protein ACR2H1_04580, partial [Limisphaerales bacterium]